MVDIAAGTGLVVELLRQRYGFSGVIDGVDGCQTMLDIAKKKCIYDKLICCKLGSGSTMNVEDGMLI